MNAEQYNILQRIRSDIPLELACERYGVNLNRQKMAVCPFHSEKTPSFKVYDSSYHCFGCGAHGDVIELVKQLHNVDVLAACDLLCRDFNLPYDINETEPKKAKAKTRKRKRSPKRPNTGETKTYSQQLSKDLFDEYCRYIKELTDCKQFISDNKPLPGSDPSKSYIRALKDWTIINVHLDSIENELAKRRSQDG